MVNNNDPIPSVPGTGMDTKPMVFGTGLAVSFANAPLGISLFFTGVANLSGAPYAHHGKLHHFMPVRYEDGIQSQILWEPGCESITNKACNEILQQKKRATHAPRFRAIPLRTQSLDGRGLYS